MQMKQFSTKTLQVEKKQLSINEKHFFKTIVLKTCLNMSSFLVQVPLIDFEIINISEQI